MRHLHGALLAVLIGLGLLVLTTDTAGATAFSQTNLVSDIAGLATITAPTNSATVPIFKKLDR